MLLRGASKRYPFAIERGAMDIFDDELKYDNKREYSKDEYPVDMGLWLSYAPYHDENQLSLQRGNLLSLPIENEYGQISFILSKNICVYEDYLEKTSKEIRIESTETVLETEVYYTSKIEGAKTTKKRTFEIHNGSPIDENNKFSESMIKGNFEAVKLLNLFGNKVDKDKLRKVWEVLTEGCRDNDDIAGELYRTGDIGIFGSDFKAPVPSEIEEKMDKLLSFMDSEILDDRPFIKAAIIHFAFETIHPFCDGNGRLGRLLMNNHLIGQGIESCRTVSFSEQIDKSLGLYEGAFQKSENLYSDCTPFLEYMLEKMSEAYGTALKVQNS